jgi:hypothetical protein
MRIVRMIGGETVRERNIKPKRTRPSLLTERFMRRVHRLLDQRADFVEYGFDYKSQKPYLWIITNCGDNCLKVYDN